MDVVCPFILTILFGRRTRKERTRLRYTFTSDLTFPLFFAPSYFSSSEIRAINYSSQVFEKVSNDIESASYGSRQEQNANGQPEESTNTLELAFRFRHAGILLCCSAGA